MMRMLLIPAFVILLLYGYRGWALVVFLTAGLTDLFDGLIARRTGQKTTLGAWLDPMADKLLLLTMFVMLTLPSIGQPNRLPLWFTVLVISRDVAIVAHRGGGEPGDRPPHLPAVDLREDRHRALHRDRRRGAVFQLSRRVSPLVQVLVYASLAITLDLGRALRRADDPDGSLIDFRPEIRQRLRQPFLEPDLRLPSEQRPRFGDVGCRTFGSSSGSGR